MNLLESALEYARLGWHVFPCRPGEKIPATPNGCHAGTTDEQTIRAWWQRWPNANIGLLCGPKSGVYAVDIDVDPERGIDGWQSLKTFEAEGNYLPGTVKQNSPRGGAHYLYKTDNPPKNKNSFRKGIDIRSDGYYILLTPSIHPNGKRYEWAEDAGPGQVDIAEYPEFMRPENEKILPPWKQSGPAEKPHKPITKPVKATNTVIDRAALYLRECEPAVQGQAGHDKLLWAARSMVVGFKLDDTTALSLLESEYNPRCVSPWNMSNPKDAKDFRRKVEQARKTPGEKPFGWLIDEYDLHDDKRQEYGKNLADGLMASVKTCEPEPVETQPKNRIPKRLLHPVGLVGDLCSWINATARKPQPLLTLAASLTFVGALLGRKIRNEEDLRTNLYAMGVAKSCAGKEHARTQIKKLVDAVGVRDRILGGEDVTSDAALEVALQTRPALLYLFDEIGHWMSNIKNSPGTHSAKIVPTLMKLYSSAKTTYLGKEYATGERRDIEQPCCCVYGTTVPSTLWEGISTAELRDGWLGRVLLFISTDDPAPRDEAAKIQAVPKHLIERVKAWFEFNPQSPDDVSDIIGAVGTWQKTVPTHPEATQRIHQFRDFVKKRQIQAEKRSDGTDCLWGRAEEAAKKVALIIAAGDKGEMAEITADHADYACELVKFLTDTFVAAVEHNISDNKVEREKKRILRIIKDAGPEGMAKANITKRTQGLYSKQRNEYIEDMAEADLIVYGRNPNKNNRTWCWEYPYGLDVLAKEQ